jgi:hypothetical protein
MLFVFCLFILLVTVQSSEITLKPVRNEEHTHLIKHEMKKNKCTRDQTFYKTCKLKKTDTYNILFNKTHYFIFDNSIKDQTLTFNEKPIYRYRKHLLERLN